MNVVLVMFRENGERRSFSLSRDVTLIGRREDADFRIPLTDVSRKHCRLIKDGNLLLMEDLGSSNGTYHNGRRVQEAEINPGDTLRIGPVQFVVQIDGIPADNDLLGSGMSGLADSAATMITPAATLPTVPPPPLPPAFAVPSAELNQPTIDKSPGESADGDVISDFNIDELDASDSNTGQRKADDAIPSPDAEVVAEASTDEPDFELDLNSLEAPDDADAVVSETPSPILPNEPPSLSGLDEQAGPVAGKDNDAIVPDTVPDAEDEDDFSFIDDSPAVEGDEVAEDDVLIDFDLPDDDKKK